MTTETTPVQTGITVENLTKAYKSKVLWFNALLAALAPFLPGLLAELMQALPALEPVLPANVYQALSVLAIAGNAYLRFRTTVPLAKKTSLMQ